MSDIGKFISRKTDSITIDGVEFKLEEPTYEKGKKLTSWVFEANSSPNKYHILDMQLEVMRACIVSPDISKLSDEDLYSVYRNTASKGGEELIKKCYALCKVEKEENPT